MIGWLGLLVPGSAPATSLQFFGNGVDDIDRVKIPIDGPAKPADVGASDFTVEWWMRALPEDNASDDVGCDANDGWITGNIIFDRDVYGPGDHGDFGVSLTGGRVAFGVGFGSSGNTICGATDVADDVWHHVAVTRQRSDGRLRIYVDGVLDAEGPGAVGSDRNVSYRDGRATSYPNSDPFLVIGAEKHDAGPAYPSYRGWIDEVRLSTVQRYTATRFTRPFSLFAPDGSTAAVYHLDEGAGDTIGDASGGGSHGTLEYGGAPAGPEWSSDAAPLDTVRRVALEQVVSGLTRPVAIAHAGDDRLFVVEADGRILAYQVTEDGPLTFLDTFLDIHGLVKCCGERGLLGLAFHPNYASNRYFFVYYTANDGDGDIVIARYQAPTASANIASPGSASVLLTIEHSTHANHNGGGMAFGPDGYLYVSVGDGGGGGDPLGSGQNLGTLLAKVLRLDVDVPGDPAPHYEIPPDNPFVGTVGAQEEIWAWGLRNPWRIAFDRVTGDLFIGDVGQDQREEVNFQLAGSPGGVNYGWPRMEGIACYNPSSNCQTGSLALPILDYSHVDGCSVTGGYRYRGTRIPTLHGGYVFGDFCQGTIWVGAQAGSGTWTRTLVLDTSLSISTFGEDARGELYVAHLGGAIHRFVRARPRLTVTRAGSGTGTVSGPGGIDCGAACSVEYEPGETVTLTAAAAANSWFAGWSGACGGTEDCVILMDGDRSVMATINPRPVLQLSAPNYSVSEGSAGATITVQRLTTTAGTVTVDYAIEAGTATPPPSADADFTGPGGALTGTLTFTSGLSSTSFTIPIVNDTRAEPPETVLLSLHNPTSGAVLGAQPTAVLTIVDNDSAGVLKWSAGTYSVNEGSGQVVLTVSRSGGSAGDVSVTYAIVGGTATAPPAVGADFTDPGESLIGTLDFGAGVMTRTLTIPVVNDGDIEPNETFTVTLQAAHGGATVGSPSVATVTIVDNDRTGMAQFSQATVSAQESASAVTLTVTRAGSTSAPATVAYQITGDTAAVNGPLTGTVSFLARQASRPLVIPLWNDDAADGNSTLTVTLQEPLTGGLALGTPNPAIVTLIDDEGTVQFAGGVFAVSEGSKSATITLTRTGETATPVTVSYATGGPGDTATPALTSGSCSVGADYRPIVGGSLTFNAGQTSKTFAVNLCGDSLVETSNPETLTLRLTGVSAPATLGAPSTAVLEILEDDGAGAFQFSSPTFAVTEGTATGTLTVLRANGAAGTVQVPWSITGGTAIPNTDYSGPTSGWLAFGPNQISASLPIPIINDAAADGPKTVVVTLGAPTGDATLGSPGVATLSINDNEPTVRFSSTIYTVSESSPSVNVTIQRLGPTNTPVSVTVGTTGTGSAEAGACGPDVDHTAVNLLVSFLSGQTSQSVPIPLCPDTEVDGTETIGLALTGPVGATLGSPNTATVQITEDDVAGAVQFTVAATSVSEAQGTASVLVTRTGGSASAVTAHWTITGGSAVHGDTPGPGVDYTGPTSGTLMFGLNQVSQALEIPVVARGGAQGPRAVTLLLDGAGGGGALGAPTSATLWILDAD